MVEVFNCRKV